MKIGILQTGRRPAELADDHTDYDVMFEALLASGPFEFDTYAVLDNEFPENANSADGWIITGSKFGAYEDHDWIKSLERLIQDISDKEVPLVGICFGHQIIAQALGGKVEKYDGGWVIGAAEYELEASDETITLHAWHQDQVVQKPDIAKVAASNDFCKFASLTYDDHILTWQPHPEFEGEYMKALLNARKSGLPKTVFDAGISSIGTKVSKDRIVRQIIDFLANHSANAPSG